MEMDAIFEGWDLNEFNFSLNRNYKAHSNIDTGMDGKK